MPRSLFHRTYYAAKPWVPWRLRNAVRGALVRRQRKQVRDVWPIMPGSEKPLADWPGWPNGKQFAFVLTHDVESRRGLDRVRQLAELEMSLGFRSAFNFVPEGEYRVPPELRAWLVDNGFEVGVHDLQHDGTLFRSREDFGRQAKRISHYLKEWNATGFRAGFMRHNLEWQHEISAQYDCSTFDTDPFEPQPDGVGTIFPFWVPNPKAESGKLKSETRFQDFSNSASRPEGKEGYVELPYTLPQDSTLFLLLRESSPDIWIQKLDWIAEHGGMALINVHPDYLQFPGAPPKPHNFPVDHYRVLLKHVRTHYAEANWSPLPNALARWCKDNVSRVSENTVVSNKSAQTGRATVGLTPLRPLSRKRAAVILYSDYPGDPRPRRAAESLVQAGMAVDLLCLRFEASEPSHEDINGVSVARVPLSHRREGKLRYLLQYGLFLIHATWFLTRRSFTQRYDLIHVHNMPDFLVFSALVPKILRARVILDLHDPMPELYQAIYGLAADSWMVRLLKMLEKWSIGFADLALTPNIAFRRLFESRSCRRSKMHILMNSPEESVFSPAVEPWPVSDFPNGPSSFRILHHGSLVHRHGLDIAVEAIAKLRGRIPGIQFLICGQRTAYLDSVLRLAESRGLKECVAYLGSKHQTDIARIITASDIGLIPNRLSPFTRINMPTRIFEYLAMNKPVMVPATEGICDYFDEGNMIFFRADDPDDLANKLLWAYEHRNEVAGIVQKGQEVYRHHLWENERRRFICMVTESLQRTGSPDQAQVASLDT